MRRLLLVMATLIVAGGGLATPGQAATPQRGFWSDQWKQNMGPPINLIEGAHQGGQSYKITGSWGAREDRCVIVGFTEDDDYFVLRANWRCHNGAERGNFVVTLNRTRPHNSWAGPCKQTYPKLVKHGRMTGERI